MIEIRDKKKCCGCGACTQVCPRKCITMEMDYEGFWYPVVDGDVCVNCGRCNATCPELATYVNANVTKQVAIINPDEYIRRQSSSGGAFSLLADYVISSGGIVYGAAFDKNWHVRHIGIECREDLRLLRGSKYLQSDTVKTFVEVKYWLERGRSVLYSGTSCQIAALNLFIGKKKDNLITVDILCHGVPSYKVWDLYRDELVRNNGPIGSISFRDKSEGWVNYSFCVKFINGKSLTETFSRNPYLKGYISALFMRPACEHCHFKGGNCGSDITLGDYWGAKEHNDNKGISIAIINTMRGGEIIKRFESYPADIKLAREHNGGFSVRLKMHPNRKKFFMRIDSQKNMADWINKCLPYPPIARLRQKITWTIQNVIRKVK